MTTVSAFVPDLMDRSRLSRADADVRVAARLDDLDPEADVVVVDLGRPGAVDAVRRLRAQSPSARIVGFASHVERELLADARDAGCDKVLARSAFFGDVAAALTR